MAVVASVSIDKHGNPTSGEGDVLVGDHDEHVRTLASRLANIAEVAVEDVKARAEAIVGGHKLVAVGGPIPAEAAAPTPFQAPAPHAVEAPVAAVEAPAEAPA